jgi:hypothetical protein
MVRMLRIGMRDVSGDLRQKSNMRGGVLLNVIAFHLCCRLVRGKSNSMFQRGISTYGHHIR